MDTTQGFKVEKRDMKADSVLMHRERNVIAVRAAQGESTVIQVFDIDQSKKLKESTVPDTIVFWRWISSTTLALIGKQAVYHLSLVDAASGPEKMFDRMS